MEMVVTAALSGDANLKQLVEEGRDLHAYTARHAFNVGWDLDDKAFKAQYPVQRQGAKIVNFALVYGGTEYTLQRNFGYSEAEASQLIEGYFKAYPGVKEWMDSVYAELEDKGFVTYPEYGYIKRMDVRSWRNWEEKRQFMGCLRSCQNALIQGYSAWIVKDAIAQMTRRFREEGLRSFVSFQIHDEIGCLAPEEEARTVFGIMEEVMTRDVQGVQLRVDGEITRTMSKSADNLLDSLEDG